jgi:hypothetical protein
MAGNSAVTVMRDDNSVVEVRGDAAKVQYSPEANVGISAWGNGNVGGRRIDSWIADFIDFSIAPGDDLETIGGRLTVQLNEELSKMGKSWDELRCGLHLAGYMNGVPRLWHIDTGHDRGSQHELRLYHDFPEDQSWSDGNFRMILGEDQFGFPAFCHLFNSHTPNFLALFDKMMEYSRELRNILKVRFPRDSLEGRLGYYKLLVQFTTEMMVAAGEHPSFNNVVSAIAFDQNVLVLDERLSVPEDREAVSEGFRLAF